MNFLKTGISDSFVQLNFKQFTLTAILGIFNHFHFKTKHLIVMYS